MNQAVMIVTVTRLMKIENYSVNVYLVYTRTVYTMVYRVVCTLVVLGSTRV